MRYLCITFLITLMLFLTVVMTISIVGLLVISAGPSINRYYWFDWISLLFNELKKQQP